MQQNKIRSFQQFKKALETDEKLQEEFKLNPKEAIQKFESKPWFTDVKIYRWAVIFLGLIVLVICIGVIILTAMGIVGPDFDVPDILIATASTAIGAIAGLLTPSSQSQDD